MRAKPYKAYKPSGVAWLGDVPAHWEAKRFGYLFRFFSGGTPSTDEAEYWDGDLPWVSAKDMKSRVITDTEDHISESAVSKSATCKLPAGSLLLVNRSGILKHSLPVAVLGREMAINQDIRGCVPRSGVDTKFIAYLIEGNQDALLALWRQQGATVESLNFELTKTTNLQLPPLPEQRAIAAFLDRETGRIDTLVAKKRELIERLQEKRTALISHAVTRGLEPKAKLKPSGLEWLSDIPAHWDTAPLKNFAQSGRRTFTDGDWVELPFITDEGVRLIQTGNVGIGAYKEQGFRYVSEASFQELRCTEVTPNDVLICRLDGPVGRACLAPNLGVRMITSVDNTILKVREGVSAEFIVYLLSSNPWLSWIEAICRVGGGFRMRVSRTMLGNIRVPVPPPEEQHLIAALLSKETAKLDALVRKAEEAIERLQEYRTALITAAVTGKIDVLY